ncbi:hypothetical protein L6R29_18075 [Myxococcota bacterium]|nr:hypothetical protein [Myxococcota bacterium]
MSSFVRVGSLGFVFFLAFVLVACGKKKNPSHPSLLCSKTYEHILRIVEKEAQSALLQAASPKATKAQKKQADVLEEEQKRLRSKQGKQRALALCTVETTEPPKKKTDAAHTTASSQKPDASNGAASPKRFEASKATPTSQRSDASKIAAPSKKLASSKKESPENRRRRVRCVLAAQSLRMIRDCYQFDADLSLYSRPMPFETLHPSAMTNSKKPQTTPSSLRPLPRPSLSTRPSSISSSTKPSTSSPRP